jgi:dolichol-phosphate mannosyltransferase
MPVKSGKSIAIIIPAYNEFENLKLLLPHITSEIPDTTVIVVDDSPEQEYRKLRKFSGKITRSTITVVRRPGKMGRGSAVIEGFRLAFRDPSISYFVEMDADLAHNPNEIRMLLSRAGQADMVIGSRYLTGSSIKDWPFYRLIQSKIINFCLNYWLGLQISDFTNGFRLYNRRAVDLLVHTPLYEKGYISLSEIAFKLSKNNFIITEVPISFTDRKFGKSNADVKELFQSLLGAIRIRLRA